ncbi:hypothetical protein M3181_06770 [Mesobacillus maritimus]|uniref:hypothetical protein n=1 Tax=Mesobacillus maritimus TaxID=1643336 RepID=UPI00203AA94A|nr:hypothetical protein [Mesobacillus maritimus]MCM3668701.1 hypothetical protein [Mesobacillus maritimus]
MKKYVVFILSFGLLYMAGQLLSGWFLTAFYTPYLSSVNGNVGQEVEFGRISIVPFLITLLMATLAYFFSQKLFVSKNK